jgi:hypothetical protein
MSTAAPADFAATEVEPDALGIEPLYPSWITRLLYVVALLGFVVSSMAQSGWVGLATGGSVLSMIGPMVFTGVTALALYRGYTVLRYRNAIAARRPYLIGWLVRYAGWLVMLVAALGSLAIVFRGPLTLMLFKTPGENGIAFFVVGLYAVMAAGAALPGVLIFELSRLIGRRPRPKIAPRSPSQRKQDWVLLAVLVAVGLALPGALKKVKGEPCFGSYGGCLSKTTGSVIALALAPLDAPIALESNLDWIEYRLQGPKPVSLFEEPAFALLQTGHPVAAAGSAAPIKVKVQAAGGSEGPVLDVAVIDGGRKVAEFHSQFSSRASIETAPGGKVRIAADVPAGSMSPMFEARKVNGRNMLVDQIYRDIRVALGTEREVAEANRRVYLTAATEGSSPLPHDTELEDRKMKECDGITKGSLGKAERQKRPGIESFMPEVRFVQSEGGSATTFTEDGDRMSCHDEAVWLARTGEDRSHVVVRKYDVTGRLQGHWQVRVPEPKSKDEHPVMDPKSLHDADGELRFRLIMIVKPGELREDRYSAKL